MTDEELATIRVRVRAYTRSPDEKSFHLKMDARALLTEVERLRAREAAFMEFVSLVAAIPPELAYVGQLLRIDDKARALLS